MSRRANRKATAGITYLSRYHAGGDPTDLQAAIGAFLTALDMLPSDHPDRPGILQAVGASLQAMFERTGDPSDLAGAIAHFDEAISADPPAELYLMCRAGLAACLMHAARLRSDPAPLQEALAIMDEVVANTPLSNPWRAGYLTSFGLALRFGYEMTGELPLLDEAVTVLRDAVADPASPHLPLAQHTLGVVLRLRAERVSSSRHVPGTAHHDGQNLARDPVRDIRESLDLLARAVDATRPGQHDHAMFVTSLGNAQLVAAPWTGGLAAVEAAGDTMRRAVALTPPGHADRPATLNSLALVLRTLAEGTGDTRLLQEAVDASRQAVDSATAGHVQLPTLLHGLAAGLATLFMRTGDQRALAEAIDAAERAVAATPATDPRRAMHLHVLAVAYTLQYEWTGELDHLHRATTAARHAVDAAPEGHPGRGLYLSGLGNALNTLAARTDDPGALAAAVEALEQAVDALPADRPERAGVLNNLGSALHATVLRTGDTAALSHAVTTLRRAVDATPVEHPTRPGHLHNLGAALRTSFLHGSNDTAHLNPQDGSDATGLHLADAVTALRLAVDGTPSDHPRRAARLASLGATLHMLAAHTGEPGPLDDARATFAAAADIDNAPASIRVLAARGLGAVAAASNDTAAALAAYETAVALLPWVSPRTLARGDREYGLGQIAGLPAEAAAAALDAGRPERAVELLEAARGILLAEAMNAHGDLAVLHVAAPDLAAQFVRLRDALEAAEQSGGQPVVITGTTGTSGATSPPVEETLAGAPTAARHADLRRRGLAEQWDPLVEQIRAVPGMAGFLRPPAFADLAAAADRGPVVLVTATERRSDALVLTANPAPSVRAVPLPDLTRTDLLTHIDRMAADAFDPRVIEAVLSWAWDTITGPVLGNIPDNPGPNRPRLWWCPVGELAFLPLHAAGRAGAGQLGVLDRVVSSYTPTVAALRHARRPATSAPNASPLIVAMPHTPGAPDLPGARTEAARITALMPGARTVTGSDATAETVLAALSDHPVVHLACHGRADHTNPAQATLLLHDHATNPLTVAAISALRLTHAELAYLSACETTRTSGRFADEALHITGAFQLAGYRSVIGTLWPISDSVAVRLAEIVYSRLTGNGGEAPSMDCTAHALHDAVLALRETFPAAPQHWAAHIHAGT